MEEMADFSVEEKKAISEPLRVADMKSMEEAIQKLANEVSGGIDEAPSTKIGTLMSQQDTH